MLKKLLFITLILLSPMVKADSATNNLIQLLTNIHTIQANFTETIVDKSGHALQKSKGLMQLQRPGKFRWEIKSPNQQLIVTNGQKLWIYDPDLEQVTIRLLTKEAGEAPALLLSNTNVSLQKEFKVQEIKDNNTTRWFLLTPTDKSSMFESIKLGFSNHQIQQMQLQDHMGHITQIQFNKMTTNLALSSVLFTFKPPKHTDVVDESR